MKSPQARIRELELCLAQLLGFVEALALPEGVHAPTDGVYEVLFDREGADFGPTMIITDPASVTAVSR